MSGEDWQRRDPARQRRWTWKFLGTTALTLVAIGVSVGFELQAVADADANTIPWTEYIARGVPWQVSLAAYLVLLAGLTWLMVWLPPHFRLWYRIWKQRDPK